MTKIEFNITTVVAGLPEGSGQVCVYGRFTSKKAAIKALDTTAYYFNGYAHFGALGYEGKAVIDLYPPNTLIAMHYNESAGDFYPDLIRGKYVITKPFQYWVHRGGDKWEPKTYTPPKEGDSS